MVRKLVIFLLSNNCLLFDVDLDQLLLRVYHYQWQVRLNKEDKFDKVIVQHSLYEYPIESVWLNEET
jgi:hypothetical protein